MCPELASVNHGESRRGPDTFQYRGWTITGERRVPIFLGVPDIILSVVVHTEVLSNSLKNC